VPNENTKPRLGKATKRAKQRAPVIEDDSDFLTEKSSDAEDQQFPEVNDPDLWAASDEEEVDMEDEKDEKDEIDEVEVDKKVGEDEYCDVDVDPEDGEEMGESLNSASKASDLNDVIVARVGDGDEPESIWRGEISEDEADEELFLSKRHGKRLRVDDDTPEIKVIEEAPAAILRKIIMSKPRRPMSDEISISCLGDKAFEKMVSCVNFLTFD
jgi:hypothetical protein